MEKIRVFIFCCLCFLFVFLFYNCAPLAEPGSFKTTDINVLNSESPKGNAGDKDANSNNNEEGEGDKDEDQGDNDENENQDPEEDENDTAEPIGEEFNGSETQEVGGTPITRGLY